MLRMLLLLLIRYFKLQLPAFEFPLVGFQVRIAIQLLLQFGHLHVRGVHFRVFAAHGRRAVE